MISHKLHLVQTFKKSPARALISVIMFAALSAACSESTTMDDPLSETTDYPTLQGEVTISERASEGQSELSIGAGFASYQTNAFGSLPTEDRCVLAGSSMSPRAIPPMPISAGTVILTGPSGTLATITEESTEYALQSLLVATDQTSNLTLDITGAEFPIFQTVSVQDAYAITNLQPAPNTETSAPVVTWDGSENSNTYLTFRVTTTSNGADLSQYFCTVLGDGEVNLADVRPSAFTDSTFYLSEVSRTVFATHLENDAVLTVKRSIEFVAQ